MKIWSRSCPGLARGLHRIPSWRQNNELAIKLVVAGDSHDRALELVRNMEDSQHFQQTRIQSENSENASGANAGDNVNFDINALYVPATEPKPGRHGQ